MKSAVVAISLSALVAAHAIGAGNPAHEAYVRRRDFALRQVPAASSSAAPATVSPTTPAATGATTSVVGTPVTSSTGVPVVSGSSSGTGAVTGSTTPTVTTISGSVVTVSTASTPAVTTPTVDGNIIPPLDQITMGAPIETPLTMFTRFAAGATPPISGAPPLPTLAIVPARYPALDKIPPTDSDEVKEWLKELDGINIPTFGPTADGSCLGDPSAASDASRCWWTCGGCARETDITVCPEKNTWGVSFDDGPSPYTPKLLNYLNEKDIKSTFFVVGSRVISRPEILQTEFMLGHEISVHTWSHHPLTAMTNEQIVAELGWTRKAIKEVLGVTPVTMRPPYGDIDDRVRAIALAMGMTPVIWTRAGNIAFDTKDWRIAGGTENGTSSYAAWQQILTNSQTIDTGFISLEHDLYQQSVDMAVGYFLPDALNHSPAFSLKPIIECLNQDAGDAYLETNPTLSADIAAATGTSTPNIAQGSTGRSATGTSGAMATQVGVAVTLAAGVFAATLTMML